MLTTGSVLYDTLGVVTALLAATIAYFKWTYQYWERKNVPFIEPTIPLGNTSNPFVKTAGENTWEMYKEMKAKGWKYGGLFFFSKPVILLMDLDLCKHILAKDFQYFTDRGGYTNEKVDPVGCHLAAVAGQKWRTLRAKLTPTFTSGKLKAMFQTLVDCGLVLEEYIEDNVKPDEPVDIKNVLACFSTDVIGSCAFGLKCNSFKEPDSLFRYYGNQIFTISKMRAIKMLITSNFQGLARTLKLRSVRQDIADFFTKVVQDTVEYRQKNNVVRKDFLQLLIDLRKGKDGETFSLEEMVAQSFIFFGAGFETSSTTMTFALFELATHPEIQDKLRKEMNEVLAKNDNKITYDSLSDMKYLHQVIDETLRVHSPARMLQRICVTDYKVPGEDLIIEKGTKVVISVKGIHYDADYWENPEEFDPDRFAEEKKRNMNQFTYLPFGHGPRACIGERFGMMQVKVGLTSLLRKFKVRLNKKTKLPLTTSVQTVVASAEGGIWLNLEKI